MYYRRSKTKESISVFSIGFIKRLLIAVTLCLFIFPPIIYYASLNNNQYPYKWNFFNTRRPRENIDPDIKLIDLYPPKDILHDCNSSVYQCPKTVHGFFVCIHDVFQDQFISVDIKHHGVWQPLLSDFLIKVFKDNPDATFIDIGANIGYFSALAASSHHYTIAIEPIPQNLELLYCTAVRNNLLKRLTLISNPVSNSHSQVTIRRGGSNQGDGRIEEGVKECRGSCPPITHSITLDDLAQLVLAWKNKHPVIVKIDAQGFESKILRGGEFFFTNVKLICIIVEWILVRSNVTSTSGVIEMLQLLHSHSFRPYNLNAQSLLSSPLHPRQWRTWPDDVAWFREDNDGHIITYS